MLSVGGRARGAACALALVLALLGAACGALGGSDGAPVCPVLSFAPGLEREWDALSASLDFAPEPPCARGGRLLVAVVFVDRTPADRGFADRLNTVVERDGTRAFVFSQTRALVPFTQIPDGSRRLHVDAPRGALAADGFVGRSPSGAGIAYLRWRTGGVTYEVAASIHRAFTERDLVAAVRSMLGRTGQPRAPASPTAARRAHEGPG
ncbi:MAG: hypothetical protein FJZ92_10915 [Chloroflexi bacterium]|nr:hypothetical protein [Chloroflexota bacterium]